MQTTATIAVWCFLSVGLTHGQDEGLLGLPLDFGDFGLDFRNGDLYKDQDIFKDDTYSENSYISPEETIRRLCNEYDLILDNHSVDCKNIKLAQKALDIDAHIVNKREAGDATQLEEGSGAGEEEQEPAPEAPVNEEPAVEPGLEETVDQPTGNETAPAETEEGPSEVSPPESKEEEPQAKEEEPEVKEVEPAAELPTGEEAKAEPAEIPVDETPQAPEGNETAPAGAESAVEDNEAPSDVKEEKPEVLDNEAPHVDLEQATIVPEGEVIGVSVGLAEEKETVTEIPVIKELGVPEDGGIKKKGRVLKPDVTDKTKESENVEADKLNSEPLKEHQSGNAIVDGTGSGTLEGSERAVKSMEPNANLKQATPAQSEEQKTGESTKDIQQGRKDSKVLIILFVAVVTVACAAFAYNFIKKRKQKKAEATRAENGGNNTTQRSLQNLSSPAKSDPEQGTELKPLMKNPEQKPVVTEYTDEKENGKTEVASK